jgi:hypothetical protein
MGRIEAVGDWDKRGLDFETYLVGPITEKIIDADRLVRQEWDNGHPNWFVYRSILAGDKIARRLILDWFIAYAVTKAATGALRDASRAEDLGVMAGWDCLARLEGNAWLMSAEDVADIGEADPKTYRKLRNRVYVECLKSLEEYFVRLQIAVRQVWMEDRWLEPVALRGKWSSGRGFGGDLDPAGEGNFVVRKAVMSDNLN